MVVLSVKAMTEVDLKINPQNFHTSEKGQDVYMDMDMDMDKGCRMECHPQWPK